MIKGGLEQHQANSRVPQWAAESWLGGLPEKGLLETNRKVARAEIRAAKSAIPRGTHLSTRGGRT